MVSVSEQKKTPEGKEFRRGPESKNSLRRIIESINVGYYVEVRGFKRTHVSSRAHEVSVALNRKYSVRQIEGEEDALEIHRRA